MITNEYANTLTQIADNTMHALDICGDMPDRINLTESIKGSNNITVPTTFSEADEFIRRFDRELDHDFLTENDVVRNGYALRTVDNLVNKWWPIYYIACKTCDSIEEAQFPHEFTEDNGVPTVLYTELGVETSAVLYNNRQTTLGILDLFSRCISVTVKYISRFYPQLLTPHLDKLAGFTGHLQASVRTQIESEVPNADQNFKRMNGDKVNLYQQFDPKLESLTQKSVLNERSKNKPNLQTSLSLSDIFEHISKYNKVMNLLVEKNYCQPGTYVWIDYASGYKSIIVSLIRHLHLSGFYKGNKLPSTPEIILIVQNTFGIKISERTVKEKAILPQIEFIKPASTY